MGRDVDHDQVGGRDRPGPNRAREQAWLASVQEVAGAAVTASAAAGDVSFTEMWFDATYKDGNRRKMQEVSVRRWAGGLVVHERFYYKGM